MGTLDGVSHEITKTTISPLSKATSELARVSTEILSGLGVNGDGSITANLEKIGNDLEMSLIEPLGGLANKTVLLQACLVNLVGRAEEIMRPSPDMKNTQVILDKMAADAIQLQREINRAVSEIPPTEGESLMFLNGLGKETNRMRGVIESLQEKVELIQDNAVLLERKQVLEKKISALKTKVLDKA
ncbi:MAG: hypothetical protein ON057_000021 [Glomeribacter sp. 1016415]|nr:hypothetical protein [Glomeribacter sp. 1016415]